MLTNATGISYKVIKLSSFGLQAAKVMTPSQAGRTDSCVPLFLFPTLIYRKM